MAIKTVTVNEGQSLFDVVLQYYGDLSRVFDFIQLNSDQIPNIMYNDLAGKTVKYEEQTNQVASYYKNNNRDFSGNIRPITTRFPQITANPYAPSFLAAVDPNSLSAMADTTQSNPWL